MEIALCLAVAVSLSNNIHITWVSMHNTVVVIFSYLSHVYEFEKLITLSNSTLASYLIYQGYNNFQTHTVTPD